MQMKMLTLAVGSTFRPDNSLVFMCDLPERVCAVWEPLETVLTRIETTGCVDVEGSTIVFEEQGDKYDLVQAIRDLMDFYYIANTRHNLSVRVDVFNQFANKLDNGSPLFETDLAKLRAAIADSKRLSMRLRVSEVTDMLDTLKLMREFQRVGIAG